MTKPEAMEQADGASHSGRNPWLLLVLVAVSFLALCAGTLLLPHDPYVRYQQLAPTLHFRTVWTYERLAFDKTPIDIAIIGNSRLQSGIAAPVVQTRLREMLGRDVHVANLSMPQEGRNAHFVIAQQLFEHHPEVKLVLLSAIEAMPRESHPAFRNIAAADTIVAAPVVINRSYLDDLAFVPYRQMSLFAQSLFPEAFELREFNRGDYLGPDFDTTQSFVSPTAGFVDREKGSTSEELGPVARERVRSITPPLLPASLAAAEFAVEYRYTRQIADLAKANGTAIGFVYLPIFANPEPLRQGDFYRAIGPVITAPCVAKRAEDYADYGHVTRAGAHDVSRKLAETLVRLGWNGGSKAALDVKGEISLCEMN